MFFHAKQKDWLGERLRNELFCIEWDIKPQLTQSHALTLQEKATKWYSEGDIDGLTTNGILVMHPVDGFAGNSKPGIWREVSVDGGIYALRESRSTPQKSSLVCMLCV